MQMSSARMILQTLHRQINTLLGNCYGIYEVRRRVGNKGPSEKFVFLLVYFMCNALWADAICRWDLKIQSSCCLLT